MLIVKGENGIVQVAVTLPQCVLRLEPPLGRCIVEDRPIFIAGWCDATAGQPSCGNVRPRREMKDELPDVVASWKRPLNRFLERDSLEQLGQR